MQRFLSFCTGIVALCVLSLTVRTMAETEYERVKRLLSCTECRTTEEILIRDGERIVPVLTEIYHREPPDEDVLREGAIYILGRIGGASVVDTLIAALADEVGHSRFYAVKALGKIGDRRAVVPLMRLLDSGRWDANDDLLIDALADLGDSRAVPSLERVAQQHKRERIREVAQSALRKLQR